MADYEIIYLIFIKKQKSLATIMVFSGVIIVSYSKSKVEK
jgi:hypothetical protein